jgi:hypothetical protein
MERKFAGWRNYRLPIQPILLINDKSGLLILPPATFRDTRKEKLTYELIFSDFPGAIRETISITEIMSHFSEETDRSYFSVLPAGWASEAQLVKMSGQFHLYVVSSNSFCHSSVKC